MYRSVRNSIVDDKGSQIAVVLATNCTKRDANMMAAFAAQQMNHELRKRELEKQAKQRKGEWPWKT